MPCSYIAVSETTNLIHCQLDALLHSGGQLQVASKRLLSLLNSLLHGLYDGRCKGLSYIADTHADDFYCGIIFLKGANTSAYFREEVSGL